MMNNHFIHYILERTQEDKSCIRFMNSKREYREYRYPTLWNDIKKYAAYFKMLGIKKGDVVCLMLPTCEEFLAAFFGAQLIQAIPVSLYPPSSLDDLDNWTEKSSTMINAVESEYLITNYKISSFCRSLRKKTEIKILIIESINNSNLSIDLDIELLNKDDTCFLQFSSGTTGMPKAVIISQENAIINAKLIRDALPTENENISVACWLPLYHDMGLVGCLLMSIFNGTDIVLIRPEEFIGRPHLWLQAMHDHKITCTTAPNFAYGLIQKRVSKEILEKLDLSHVKAMLCGAEMVYKETTDKFMDHMITAKLDSHCVLPVYGMAETTLAVTFTKKAKGMNFIKVNKIDYENGVITLDSNGLQICSVGETLDTFNIKIIDHNENELSDNQVGKVLISGPCVTKGYYKDLEKTASLFIDNWLDTGDEGFIHNNQLFICGRIKDTMIIRGRNYYPTIFEEKLYQIDGIRKGRAIVTSLYNPNSNTEEVVVLAEAANVKYLEKEIDKIKKEINQVIAREFLPINSIELFKPGTLKKTSSGKLKRRENLKLWQDNKLLNKSSFSVLRKSFQLFFNL